MAKRLIELSKTAYYRDTITYSDFLNLNELNILHSLPKDMLDTNYATFGGYNSAERQMAAFLPDALSFSETRETDLEDIGFPFAAVSIAPLHEKFAQILSHRDYLGAILNLGIERSKLGDILVEGDKSVVFIHEGLSSFLQEELSRVGHTSVKLCEMNLKDYHYTPRFEEIKGTVASVRLDSLLSLVFSSSRTKLTSLIEGEKVFVNGRLMTTNSCQVKEEDVISVRGMGKIRYKGILSRTKKNRFLILIHKYI
ncbi:S4 domain protein [Clostridium sp. C105KSO13]|nr:S4 domain protein [Clostridium sp. C105KSO13]